MPRRRIIFSLHSWTLQNSKKNRFNHLHRKTIISVPEFQWDVIKPRVWAGAQETRMGFSQHLGFVTPDSSRFNFDQDLALQACKKNLCYTVHLSAICSKSGHCTWEKEKPQQQFTDPWIKFYEEMLPFSPDHFFHFYHTPQSTWLWAVSKFVQRTELRWTWP